MFKPPFCRLTFALWAIELTAEAGGWDRLLYTCALKDLHIKVVTNFTAILICILNSAGEVVVHKNIPARTKTFLRLTLIVSALLSAASVCFHGTGWPTFVPMKEFLAMLSTCALFMEVRPRMIAIFLQRFLTFFAHGSQTKVSTFSRVPIVHSF